MLGRDGDGVGSSSASGRSSAEGSKESMAKGGTGAANADPGRGGKEGGGGGGDGKTGEGLSCPKAKAAEKGSGSDLLLSSSKTSGGIPSGKVRLLDTTWIDNT